MGNVQRMRRILAVLGAVAAVVAAAGIAAHYIGLVNTMVARIASFTPLFVILAMVAVLMLSAARQRGRATSTVAAILAGAVAAGQHQARGGRCGRADADGHR